MKVDMNPDWMNKKYIYLDWNVFRYMIDPRKDNPQIDIDMLNTVRKLKKKYVFPVSEGHIKDRISRYKPEYRDKIESDFQFVETITDRFILVSGEQIGKQDKRLVLCKGSLIEALDDEHLQLLNSNEGNLRIVEPDPLKFQDFKVDMSKIGEDHPLYDFLIEHNEIMSASSYQEYIVDLFTTIFSDVDVYRKLRQYVIRLASEDLFSRTLPPTERLQIDRLLYQMAPMLDACDDDEEELAKKWRAIVDRWYEVLDHGVTLEQKIKEGYTLLDFHPKFNDKLKKHKNTLDNIVRDGNHCFYGSSAEYFVSEDEKTRRKTSLIYKAYGFKTKVVSVSEFLNVFEIA